MLYTKALQPYVVKVYECTPSGLIAVTEYVQLISLKEFMSRQDEMREILEDITKNYLVGDVGITSKNYVNWGVRSGDKEELCILDYAYIYNTKFGTFMCSSCESRAILKYDKDFVEFTCPACGKKYTFGQIRRRITRKNQEDEIGDIRRLSYNVKEAEQYIPLNLDFEPEGNKKKKNKLKFTYVKEKDYNDYYWDNDETENNDENVDVGSNVYL